MILHVMYLKFVTYGKCYRIFESTYIQISITPKFGEICSENIKM